VCFGGSFRRECGREGGTWDVHERYGDCQVPGCVDFFAIAALVVFTKPGFGRIGLRFGRTGPVARQAGRDFGAWYA